MYLNAQLRHLIERLEQTALRLEELKLEEYLRYSRNWKKRLFKEMLLGIARGIGFSVGFTILGALVLGLLRSIALANLPVIGRFLADLVHIVETNL